MIEEYAYVIDCNGSSVRKDIQEVFDIIEKYFKKLTDGTHVLCIPDPFYKLPLGKDAIDKIISNIDADWDRHEYWRTSRFSDKDLKKQYMPIMSRLCGAARKCMIQEIHKCLKYQKEHEKEYFEMVEDPMEVFFENYERDHYFM